MRKLITGGTVVSATHASPADGRDILPQFSGVTA